MANNALPAMEKIAALATKSRSVSVLCQMDCIFFSYFLFAQELLDFDPLDKKSKSNRIVVECGTDFFYAYVF